jgi:hypothetical protein
MYLRKEDYLKAKKFIKEYELKNHKDIGIICLDKIDYDEFRKNIELDDLYTFHKISKIVDLHGLSLDEYVETSFTKNNDDYSEIIQQIEKFYLKPKK